MNVHVLLSSRHPSCVTLTEREALASKRSLCYLDGGSKSSKSNEHSSFWFMPLLRRGKRTEPLVSKDYVAQGKEL